MADRDGWVNAEVTLVIPLDTVKPSDSSWAKQEALADAIERVANALPPELAECCGFGRWEDVEAEATPPAHEAVMPNMSTEAGAEDKSGITADRCDCLDVGHCTIAANCSLGVEVDYRTREAEKPCKTCGGSRAFTDTVAPCPSCGGSGRTETTP